MELLPNSIAIDSETTGVYIHHGCRGFLFTAYDWTGERFYWKFRVDPFTRNVIYDADTVEDMRSILSTYDTWIFHNAVFDITVLDHVPGGHFQELYSVKNIEDTMLMGHCFNSLRGKSLKETAEFYFNYPVDDEASLDDAVKKCQKIAAKLGWQIASNAHPHLRPLKRLKHKCDFWLPEELNLLHPEINVDPAHAKRCLTYGLNDAERTMGLYVHYREELIGNNNYQHYHKNAECIIPVKEMQDAGFAIKNDRFNSISRKAYLKKEELLNRMREIVGDADYNPSSGPQTQAVLYDRFGLPVSKRTSTGSRSVDKECLAELEETPELTQDQGEFITSLSCYRKVSTAEGFLKSYKIYQCQNRLYSSIKIAGTKTLRLASSDPNAQNISKKVPKEFAELGPIISLRGMFGPPEGHIWLCIDYSQLQLRIFAAACKDQLLIDSFEQGLDIHDTVARKVFDTDTPTTEQRIAAKGINFGIIFGAGKNKIERMTGMPGSFEEFKRQFPLVNEYILAQADLAKASGYCRTLGGYPLHVPRKTAYKACNYVVQGTEGELVKRAISKTNAYCGLSEAVLRPVMVIHDEIIFESKMPITEADFLTNHKDQKDKIELLMTDASYEIGVVTTVDSKITSDLWLTAA